MNQSSQRKRKRTRRGGGLGQMLPLPPSPHHPILHPFFLSELDLDDSRGENGNRAKCRKLNRVEGSRRKRKWIGSIPPWRHRAHLAHDQPSVESQQEPEQNKIKWKNPSRITEGSLKASLRIQHPITLKPTSRRLLGNKDIWSAQRIPPPLPSPPPQKKNLSQHLFQSQAYRFRSVTVKKSFENQGFHRISQECQERILPVPLKQ